MVPGTDVLLRVGRGRDQQISDLLDESCCPISLPKKGARQFVEMTEPRSHAARHEKPPDGRAPWKQGRSWNFGQSWSLAEVDCLLLPGKQSGAHEGICDFRVAWRISRISTPRVLAPVMARRRWAKTMARRRLRKHPLILWFVLIRYSWWWPATLSNEISWIESAIHLFLAAPPGPERAQPDPESSKRHNAVPSPPGRTPAACQSSRRKSGLGPDGWETDGRGPWLGWWGVEMVRSMVVRIGLAASASLSVSTARILMVGIRAPSDLVEVRYRIWHCPFQNPLSSLAVLPGHGGYPRG